jgi:predicted dehydrogenase
MKPYRLAIIGLGSFTDGAHLPAYATMPEVEVVAGCARTEATRTAQAARWGIPALYADAEEMLARQHPDLVVICSPPETHLRYTLAALRGGAHVYCEKPFVQSLEECDAVLAAEAQTGRRVMVGQNFRNYGVARAARALVGTAGVGAVRAAVVGQFQWMTHEQDAGWRRELLLTTERRVWYEFGNHVCDLLRCLFAANAETVYARMPRLLPGVPGDLTDFVLAEFPGGRVANVSIVRVARGVPERLTIRLVCEEADLVIRWPHTLEVQRGEAVEIAYSEEAAQEVGDAAADSVRQTMTSFFAALEAGAEPPTSARDNRRTLELVFGAYESARTGNVVRFDE